MSDSWWPHRRQPTRLPCPWDSPGKNTGVGCHFLLQCMKVKSESEVAQSCPTLSDPMDRSLTGSSVHGIFQARVLESGAIAFSKSLNSIMQQRKSFIPLLFFFFLKKVPFSLIFPLLLCPWSKAIYAKIHLCQATTFPQHSKFFSLCTLATLVLLPMVHFPASLTQLSNPPQVSPPPEPFFISVSFQDHYSHCLFLFVTHTQKKTHHQYNMKWFIPWRVLNWLRKQNSFLLWIPDSANSLNKMSAK